MGKVQTQSKSSSRPPVVVVLGHVDHGKTTLLDYIRSTKVASREAGGITQGIGASVITTSDGKEVTFIDTPGHAAFTNMRAQGAKVADIAVLVVGGDDGVKPQTKEALEKIMASGVPFVVAATKSDLPSFSRDRVKSELEKLGVHFEGSGGDVPLVEISAKTGSGVGHLLEMISLIAQMHEISADTQKPLEGVIIEAGHDKRGALASIIVRNGSIKVGDTIVSQDQQAKVRALFDDNGQSVGAVGPGRPALVLGFVKPPVLGSYFWHKSDKSAVATSEVKKPTLVDSKANDKPRFLIKAKTSGALSAIIEGISDKVNISYSAVGAVNESDVFLAKTSTAKIFSFEMPVSGSVEKLAGMEGVKIEVFDIIYKLFERIDEILKGAEEVILGRAKIIATFPYENKTVAGSRVLEGTLSVGASVSLFRDEQKLGDTKIVSIKKVKNQVGSVGASEECGVLFSTNLAFEVGDMIISARS